MIIKSMARKAPTFSQLIQYIDRDAEIHDGAIFARNLYHLGQDQELVASQFLNNYRYLPDRKNGNALYHEIIALPAQSHLPQSKIANALLEMADQYCAKRAPHQLAWGRVHFDSEFPHLHLMISANGVRSKKRVRLSKADFAKIQTDIEAALAQKFPEIIDNPVYQPSHKKETPKVTKDEGEMTRRRGEASKKEDAAQLIKQGFYLSSTWDDLKVVLKEMGFELYKRGETHGVKEISSGRRYRLKTLGLDSEMDRLNARDEDFLSPDAKAIMKEHQRASELMRQRQVTTQKDNQKTNKKANEKADQKLDQFEREHPDEREL